MDYLTFFAVLVVLTYGVVCSPLLAVARIALSALLGPLAQSGIYCPVCVGTWVAAALTAAGLFPGDRGDLMTWVQALSFSAAGIHLVKSVVPAFLRSNAEMEEPLVDLFRANRAARK